MEMSTARKWLLIFGFCTFSGLLSASTYYTEQLLEERPEPFARFLVYELTASYAFFLLLPLIFWFARKFPFQRSTWYAVLPLHILFSMGIGAAHTTLMTLARTPLFPLLFGKTYRVGDPFYRYLMEYQKQVIVYIAIMITIHLFRAYSEKRAREKRAAELELEAAQLRSRLAEAQLNVLRGEVQPHFLFNTLNMISSLMYDDVAKADRMIGQLSNLLRVSLDHGQRPKVQLGREIEFARSYLEIMSARFEDRLRFHFDVPSGLNASLVPGFVIQPLVENAVKHGMRGDEGLLEINIEASAAAGNLAIQVLDNGPGLAGPPSHAMVQGVGLSNTRERLERIYHGRFRFEIGNRPEGGCGVRIEIPLESDDSAARTREVA